MNQQAFSSLPKLILGTAAVAVIVGYCQAQKKGDAPSAGAGPAVAALREMLTTNDAPLKRDGTIQKSYADVIDKIEPAVVKISTAQEVILRRRRASLWDDPFLRRLYGLPDEPAGPAYRAKRPLGLGSGVIVTKDGYILTNNHVIAEATEIKVSVPGRPEELDAKVINTDPENDVAVIKVNSDNLPVATLADSSQVRRGDVVFAVGAPFGYDQSVTMGIVSAIGRREVGVIGQGQENLIQTDAAINPGNSGGPLIDAEGRVIGINTAIFSNTGSTVNIGFAIPINRVVQVATALVNPRQTGQSGYLGVQTDTVTPEIAKLMRLPESHGAYVREIVPDGPAQAAGVLVDDIILDFQGRRVEGPQQLVDEIQAMPAGREVTLGLWRDGEKREIKVKLGDRTAASRGLAKSPDALEDDTQLGQGPYGLRLAELEGKYRRELGLSDSAQGVLVQDVQQNSNAAGSGIQPGDLIVRINKVPISSLTDAKEAFAKNRDGLSILHVWRPGKGTITIVLQEK